MELIFDFTRPIVIGADHAGIKYKTSIVFHLSTSGYQVSDLGTYTTDPVDYPDFAHPTALSVAKNEAAFGILICGSANGVAITANKHPAVRAAICWQKEIAELARRHNNANVLCIPARFISIETAIDIVDSFLATPFEGGRHQLRVDKISC
jgi:ribose 5-phosphate isomerase B